MSANYCRTLILAACTSLGAVSTVALAQDKIQFNRDIRPILSENCFKCHGPAARKAGVRLDSLDEAIKPAKSGVKPVVPGKPQESAVVERIFAKDPADIMPPASSHKTLKAAEKERIRKWIAEGAVYQKHWSFEPPVKATLPKIDGLKSGNPIDLLLAARLQKDGLTFSKEADRPTLIRRVSFALTGLPPTLAELDAYLQDTSSDAYEKMVDRYLASKHYGEEMARHWLDLARYGDTHGLHLDNERQMWLYRDWVVKAYNQNMPFDRFTIEQLAGDLLPKATSDQLVATGFNRCNVTTAEGGSIDSEWVFRNAVDRASTTAETWLGLTAGCAVCHDHKFDPISAKDFYSLYAFFYSVDGPALDGNALLPGPNVKAPTPAQEKRQAELGQLIAKVEQEMAAKMKTVAYHDPASIMPKTAESEKLASDPTRSFRAWLKKHGDAKKLPADVQALLKRPKHSSEEEKKLLDYYVQHICTMTRPVFDPLAKQIAGMAQERTALEKSLPASIVFKELSKPRETFVMMRGQYDKPGDKVEPRSPTFLPTLVKGDPKGRATRLDLANWLVSPEQPLTARVIVNRYWQQFFGTGLVKTSEDFGAQGEPPSHPELLDYLAIWFRENHWDVKGLVRLMLHSAAFRQSSVVTAELHKRDPDNRLYARGPRFRLDAEQIRDNALFVGGLMNLDMGGRGVKPYQPPRIWEPVAFSGSNTGNYVQDKGAALYRRSIYAFIKRTAPPPFMASFDAPNREQFCSRRERGNTPLQALQLMNDVQHFEAARVLAERILVEGGKSPADRVRFAFRVVLSRQPEPMELNVVQKTLEQYADRYQRDMDAAKKLVHVGERPPRAGLAEPELAAWTMVANLLLNLDETLNRN